MKGEGKCVYAVQMQFHSQEPPFPQMKGIPTKKGGLIHHGNVQKFSRQSLCIR